MRKFVKKSNKIITDQSLFLIIRLATLEVEPGSAHHLNWTSDRSDDRELQQIPHHHRICPYFYQPTLKCVLPHQNQVFEMRKVPIFEL